METQDNKFYYSPTPDARTYENALIKAGYLVDNGYVSLSEGYTKETLVDTLVEQELIINNN